MKVIDGFLIINKNKGCTSHDCVKQIRKLFNTKKVGHTGTLDPQVTGTLPIAIGKATRFIQYLPQSKTYLGEIKLGLKTKTDDIHGEIISRKEWPILSFSQLDTYLNNFRGSIKQIPPNVSSVHVNGVRAYKRTQNSEEFVLLPKAVFIEELLLKKWDQINGTLEIKISCSSGTYIRSIARDLGKILNSEGCLLKLKRISACGFNEKDSIKISELTNIIDKNKYIIPTINALNHLSTLVLNNQNEIDFWKTGREVKFNLESFSKNCIFDQEKPIKIIDNEKKLLGIGFFNKEQTTIQPKLVLNAN